MLIIIIRPKAKMTVLTLQTSIILITTELDVLISTRDGGKNRKKN